MTSETWLPIPVAPKYEINRRGDVRNIKSGRTLKPLIRKDRLGNVYFSLRLDEHSNGKHKTFHRSGLLWLTHGIIPKCKTHSRIVVPVIVSRGNERHYFDNCKQAARLLARREHYSVNHVAHLFYERQKEIYGWRINYQR